MLPDPWFPEAPAPSQGGYPPSTQAPRPPTPTPAQIGIRLLDSAPFLETELICNLEVVISPEWALAMNS